MQSVCHNVFLKKSNEIKTPEVTEESLIPSNKDFFLNWPSNHYAAEAVDTFKEQVLGALLRCKVKDWWLQC